MKFVLELVALTSHVKVFSKAPHLAGLLQRLDFLSHNYCEQNKTVRSKSTNGVIILISLLLDQKLHLLPQAHHNFEINLTSLLYKVFNLDGTQTTDNDDDQDT